MEVKDWILQAAVNAADAFVSKATNINIKMLQTK
jgi:hypothetical protein